MRKIALGFALLVSALVVGPGTATGGGSSNPAAASSPPPRGVSWTLFGKTHCMGEVPAPIACDVTWRLPPVPTPATASAGSDSFVARWLAALRERVATQRPQHATR